MTIIMKNLTKLIFCETILNNKWSIKICKKLIFPIMQKRCQQRGIPIPVVEFIVQNGYLQEPTMIKSILSIEQD